MRQRLFPLCPGVFPLCPLSCPGQWDSPLLEQCRPWAVCWVVCWVTLGRDVSHGGSNSGGAFHCKQQNGPSTIPCTTSYKSLIDLIDLFGTAAINSWGHLLVNRTREGSTPPCQPPCLRRPGQEDRGAAGEDRGAPGVTGQGQEYRRVFQGVLAKVTS